MLSACRARGGLTERGVGGGSDGGERRGKRRSKRGGLRGIRKQLEDSPSSFQLGMYNGISLGVLVVEGRCVLQPLLGSLAACPTVVTHKTCVCVPACVCVRAREGRGDEERERECDC